ncbi:CHAT domain-containing tetratricopeptide repeat protein [Calothrix sp. NIES-2098]|uniref:CHAT domain-containing tetratricopeptide repeat protein n=1 Tax=Calothrix sp. NIES-2098 TaxID=1954171 RepID=UPI000B606497|nr:TPR repeat-containing protein [Calothrix sp. NIES-2098]
MKKVYSNLQAASSLFAPWLAIAAITTVSLLSIPVKSTAQQQSNSYSAEQRAALQEAEQLNQQANKLYQEGKYSSAIPLAERTLAIREQVLGSQHLDVAESLNNLAILYREQGNYQQAEPLFQRSLAIAEKVLGNSHPIVATSLNNLALVYQYLGNYQQAEPLFQRSLAIRTKVLGNEHPDVATSLNNLANLYQKQGKYQSAEPLYQQAVSIYEKLQGKEHPNVATSLNNLAEVYRLQGKYQQAEPLYQHALSIYNKVLGNSHQLVANTLNNLGLLYTAQAKYQQAEVLYQHSLDIYKKLFGEEHPEFASTLNNLAFLYKEIGNYQQSEVLYQRSLAIREKILGNAHPDVAQSLNNLALLYQAQGKYQQAEPFYQRSLAIIEKVLGKEHPHVALALNNLALLYQLQGKYQQAEPLFQRSLAIREKVLGDSHSDVAQSLNNLALLYQEQGNYDQAEILFQRSLAIDEKIVGKEHPDVALSLNNLANLYREEGKFPQAETLFQDALTIYEKTLGNEHPNVALTLNNLALVYQYQGNYQKAEPLLQRTLAIQEKILGNSHPDVALSLNNLAALYQYQGNYEKAEPLFLRSLAIYKKILGNEHPSVATNLTNLALLYQNRGDIARAIDFLHQALEIEEHNLKLIFAVGSEQRKQNYVRTFTGTTDLSISLALNGARNNSTAASLALTTVLRRKGLVLDAVADSIQILRAQLDSNPKTQKLFTQWLQVQQQLSSLVFSEAEKQTANSKSQLEELDDEKQQLEAAISTKSAEFRTQTQSVELATIQAKIPQDAALVEIVQYQPYNPKSKVIGQRWDKPRYAVAVLHSAGEPKWIDLGDAAEINQLAINFQAALATGKPFKKLARSLDKQLIEPILPLLENARHLLISPDGQLTLIPFEALTNEQGQFLIQNYAFSYLTSGRDLLRFAPSGNKSSAPLVLADIDYNNQLQAVAVAKAPDVRGSQNLRSGDLANLVFDPLDATKAEATAIKAVLPNAQVLLGKDATETTIKKLHSPSILHLATHGFFISDVEQNLNASRGTEIATRSPKILQIENPLLRSGLALAGANKRNQVPANSDDGVLTALEVAGLDLRSTNLVVLSACETGRGDVQVGDGVYGLRRALVMAGAQTQILSLWQVDDAATKELMVKYYQSLKAGKGRHEALRSAQIELLNSQNYQHPRFWAAFVPSGNWTPLNEK